MNRPNDAAAAGENGEEAREHFVVCGLGRFGLRVVELLCQQGRTVVVVTAPATRADRKRRARELGARLIEGDFRFQDVLLAAGVTHARALLLVSGNSAANLETGLEAKLLAPDLRVVMRSDSDKLAERLQRDFDIAAVLSPPVLAARHFARAALEAPPAGVPRAPAGARLPRRLNVDEAGQGNGAATIWRRALLIGSGLLALYAAGVAVFGRLLRLSVPDAILFTSTVITNVGFGGFDLSGQPAAVKLLASVLLFGQIVLIAVVSSFLTKTLLTVSDPQRRAEQAARRCQSHVILCGLGAVGFEVAEDLIAQNVRVVVVDATPGDVHWQNLSERVPLLVGDAARPDVLLQAGLDRARALIAATSDDAVNLEIGLVAQTLVEERRPQKPLRLVLRCFDPDLARRIHAVSNVYTLLSSAEIAAPLFVQAATRV